MERWSVSRCLVLLCPVSIHPSSMASAVPSVSVSLGWSATLILCGKYGIKPQNFSVWYLCLKMTMMVGPRGRNGLSVRPPVDAEGNRGADPVMTFHPAPGHQSKPAAACSQSVTARVRLQSASLIYHMILTERSWLNGILYIPHRENLNTNGF